MTDKQKNNVTIALVFLVFVICISSYFIYKHIKSDYAANVASASQSGPIINSDPSTPSQPNLTPSTPPASSDLDANGCYTPANVRNHFGETACVDYNVGYVYQDRAGTEFLDQLSNYTKGFVGYIPYNSSANIDINALQGKNIKVTGLIQEYRGYPEIIINNTSQVEVL